jgi:site-specific recombinase
MKNQDQQEKQIAALLNPTEQSKFSIDDCVDLLSRLTAILRPLNVNDSVSIAPLLAVLNSDANASSFLKQLVNQLLHKRKFAAVLTDNGILKDARFLSEVRDRIVAKFLPEQPDKDTLEYVLNQLFYKDNDFIWLEKVPHSEVFELTHLLGITSIYTSTEDHTPLAELINTISLIMQRASGRALESEVLKMVPKYANLESPFEAFEKEFDLIVKEIRVNSNHSISSSDIGYKQLHILLKQCYDFIDTAFENSKHLGISIRVNQNLLRIRQQLDRISVLLPLLAVDSDVDRRNNSLQLVLLLIRYNCNKNNIRQLIEESTSTIAFEITTHTAETGEHYITHDRKEYMKMFKAALGGGVIVGVLCILKILISKLEISEFGFAFLYSMNYSLGFIAIYLLGFTLATKQPAMTASAIVNAIEKDLKNEKKVLMRHAAFANLFSRLFRSQFIAFVGNVLAAFPVALLGAYMIDSLAEYNIAHSKWPKLLNDVSPLHSKAIFHASIAGIFLFMSGIISGSIANRHKHNRIVFRIQEHPWLKLTIGKTRAGQLSKWVGKKWPGVASNFWFGVFMGSTASIGVFLGLDLDIRHITFAAGNFSLGLYGSHWDASADLIFWVFIGVGIIGFMNFIVSFLLSLGLAMRSRNIPLAELGSLFSSVWIYFKINPLGFFFPVKD